MAEGEQEECGVFDSGCKNAVSDLYEKIKCVTAEDVNQCIVKEIKRCEKERKR